MVALLGLGVLVSLLAARLIVNSAADDLSNTLATGGPGAIIGGQLVLDIANSYREFARNVLVIGLVAAIAATASAWLIESRPETTTGGEPATIVDGWFLALAGLVVALAVLLLLGLTAVTLAVVAGAWVIWLAAVYRWRRSASGSGRREVPKFTPPPPATGA
jgi:hypothetical protein